LPTAHAIEFANRIKRRFFTAMRVVVKLQQGHAHFSKLTPIKVANEKQNRLHIRNDYWGRVARQNAAYWDLTKR
jgi:hypothetical protein